MPKRKLLGPIPTYDEPLHMVLNKPKSVVPESISTIGDEKLPRGPAAPLMWQEARNLVSRGNPIKKKRRTTHAQRIAANVRERKRMNNLNLSFEDLRLVIPTFANERKLSRIQTLRLAIMYIAFMTEMLSGKSIYQLLEETGIVATFAWELPRNDQRINEPEQPFVFNDLSFAPAAFHHPPATDPASAAIWSPAQQLSAMAANNQYSSSISALYDASNAPLGINPLSTYF